MSSSSQQVLEALQGLYHNPDPSAKKRANEWLQEFQHSVSSPSLLLDHNLSFVQAR